MDTGYLLSLMPPILLDIVNDKLRLGCDGLDEFALTFSESEQASSRQLEGIGYHYYIVRRNGGESTLKLLPHSILGYCKVQNDLLISCCTSS